MLNYFLGMCTTVGVLRTSLNLCQSVCAPVFDTVCIFFTAVSRPEKPLHKLSVATLECMWSAQ